MPASAGLARCEGMHTRDLSSRRALQGAHVGKASGHPRALQLPGHQHTRHTGHASPCSSYVSPNSHVSVRMARWCSVALEAGGGRRGVFTAVSPLIGVVARRGPCTTRQTPTAFIARFGAGRAGAPVAALLAISASISQYEAGGIFATTVTEQTEHCHPSAPSHCHAARESVRTNVQNRRPAAPSSQYGSRGFCQAPGGCGSGRGAGETAAAAAAAARGDHRTMP